MRRVTCLPFLVATLVVALVVGLGGPSLAQSPVPGPPPTEVPDSGTNVPDAVPEPQPEPAPQEALEVADRVTSGDAEATDPSATVALRDLFLARPSLGGADRRLADTLLARPTDGIGDTLGHGYTVASRALCGPNVCVHYVNSTVDAPTDLDWVRTTLATMERVYTTTTGAMKFRRPVTDGIRGGNGRLDVYLKNLGPLSVYGYCAPEVVSPRNRNAASGYCVLDNDFSAAEYRQEPISSLRATAAHEFFHTVQFAYDFAEDRWMMESTATWIEERLFSEVNDNRQYLRVSQLALPRVALDTFGVLGNQYGNWIFWEYLSSRFGRGVVRQVWELAGERGSARSTYSLRALEKRLRREGGFARVYGQFHAALTMPARYLPEGSAYARQRVRTSRLMRVDRRAHSNFRLDHLTGRSLRYVPGKKLKRKSVRLHIEVSGPPPRSGPATTVLVHRRNGRVERRSLRFDRRGRASTRVPFRHSRITSVTVSVANASTRYRCGSGTLLACRGIALDDRARFGVRVRVVRTR